MKKDENSKAVKPLTYRQMLKDPSLAPWREALLIIENKPNKDIFPKKYEMCMIDAATMTLVELIDKNPKISLKMALIGVIKSLPKDITDTLLAKVTQHVFEKWPVFMASVQKEPQIVTPLPIQKQDLVEA